MALIFPKGHFLADCNNVKICLRKYGEAINLCSKHSVSLTEELADLLSPPPGYPGRNQLLDQLAECALSQANYHLATKKYTQAGQKVSKSEREVRITLNLSLHYYNV